MMKHFLFTLWNALGEHPVVKACEEWWEDNYGTNK